MSPKTLRYYKIRTFLRMQSSSCTLTEIHEALTKRMGVEASRKTIERDLQDLVTAQHIRMDKGVPSRYLFIPPIEVSLSLKVEELKLILALLDPTSEIYLKIKKAINY